MTSRSVSGSWSAIDTASAPKTVTAASTTERSSASPPGGSRREAAAARAATPSSAAAPRVLGHRRASCVSRPGVRDDEGVGLEADEPAADEIGEQPVHGLPGAADHARELRLGVRPVEPDLAAGSARLAGPLGRARELRDRGASRLGRSRKWSASTWSVRRRSSRASARTSERRIVGWRRTAARSRRGRGRASRSARARPPTPSAAPRRASRAPRRTGPVRGWRGSRAHRCRATAAAPSRGRSRRRTARHPGRPGGTPSRRAGTGAAEGMRGRRRGRPRRRARTARIARAPPARTPRRSTACPVAHRTRIVPGPARTLRASLRSRTRRARRRVDPDADDGGPARGAQAREVP